MDVDKLAIDLLLKGMTQEQQTAALDSIKDSVAQAKAVQKQRIGENVQVVVQALKKLEADIRARYDETGKAIEKRVASIKDGKDGRNGVNGKDGKDGRAGQDGATGPRGADGLNGRDGRDGDNGVSVTDANIDFDGSLIITLSSGRTINVGEVVAPDLAEQIKVITNGGGTSQTVIDALASLQTQINNLIPSQTGNAGKFLTTNGTDLSWAQVAGGLSYQGTWNASTNTPTLVSSTGSSGYYYVVATAGSTNLDGITDWQIGDWLLFNGTVWQKIDQSNLVTSVNGQTGAVSLTSTNISEGTNLYYTDARARAAVSAGTGISYDNSTGVITNAAPDQTVALTGAGTTTVTGTYPNFTISSADSTVGTVTSVGGTGTVNGISLSGTVTSSGNLTLGGTLDLSSPPAIGGSTPAAGSFSSLTDSGNLNFTGTGNRITGDFSTNAPISSQVIFQTSTVNGATRIIAIPSGTSVIASLDVFNNSDPTNAARGRVLINSTELRIDSAISGTGTYLPMTFYTGGSERVRVDTSGNVGVGTSSPGYKLDVAQNSAANNFIGRFINTDTGASSGAAVLVTQGAVTAQLQAYGNNTVYFGSQTNHPVAFQTNSTERARIDSSGNLLVGVTSVFSSGKQCIAFTGGTVQGLNIRNNADNPADTFVGFYNAYGTKVGSITAGGSTTTYNTSSDYRLKENVQPLVNALDKVMALKPVSYTWKSGGEDNGFIAHELQLILPKAVSGEKDAVNEDDTINPQGVDYSKIVATLTAALQELKAIVDAQAVEIAALKAI